MRIRTRRAEARAARRTAAAGSAPLSPVDVLLARAAEPDVVLDHDVAAGEHGPGADHDPAGELLAGFVPTASAELTAAGAEVDQEVAGSLLVETRPAPLVELPTAPVRTTRRQVDPSAHLGVSVQGGRRTARRLALERARRRRRLRLLAVVVAGAALAVPLALAAPAWIADEEAPVAATMPPVVLPPGVDPQPTILLATFDETDVGAGAAALAILGHDRVSGHATLLLVPSTTVADIPGRGLLQLGTAFAMGDAPLLDASVDNLLGIDVDHVVAVSRQGWSSLFTRTGGLEVDVPERLRAVGPDGATTLRFDAGLQQLDGPRLGELMTLAQPGEAELARLSRAQRVVESMLARFAAEPAVLDDVFADGAPMLDTTATPESLRELFELASAAGAAGDLTVLTLPVAPRGTGEGASYEVDTERATPLLDRRFGASRPTGLTGQVRRLQVLNGNGTPGVGQAVAEQLIPQGFRVVLTGNADRFTYPTTQVVVYDDDPDVLATAEGIVATLGVGEVVLSDTPQSVVDITIVVGADVG